MSDTSQLDRDKRAVRDLVHRVFDSYASYDPALVDKCDVDDCTIWDLFEPDLVKGGRQAREQFREKDMSDSAARGELIMNIEEPLIDVWGDFAVARYYLDYEFKPPGALQGRVRITTVARRVDGQWLRVHHHEGAVPTGRPPMETA